MSVTGQVCYSVARKDSWFFVLLFLTKTKSMWFSFVENLKSWSRTGIARDCDKAGWLQTRVGVRSSRNSGRGCAGERVAFRSPGIACPLWPAEICWESAKQSWVHSNRVRQSQGCHCSAVATVAARLTNDVATLDFTDWSSGDLREFVFITEGDGKKGVQYCNLKLIPLVGWSFREKR